ncbi:MAG: hypothetical protein ACOZNI_31480 [Myxococcota bacterium]
MDDEAERSRAARRAAERALVRVVHHYGGRPEFVVLGGLVPELLCAGSGYHHAGTTDVDVQVDLEIALGAVQTRRLELALRNAEFEPDGERIWRWTADGHERGAVVKFELLADLPDQAAGVEVVFEGCEALGAANLRGTGFAVKDIEVRTLTAKIGGVHHVAEVNVTGLAGFLLAKCAAAHSRRKRKDWYDIAFVLLHNDQGGHDAAFRRVLELFRAELRLLRTALGDLQANFSDPRAQGPVAYADQMLVDHEGLDGATLRADAVIAVRAFCEALLR